MTARALALLAGIALTLLLAAWVKPEAVDAALGRAMPTAQAGGPTDPSRAVSALTGAHPYRGHR